MWVREDAFPKAALLRIFFQKHVFGRKSEERSCLIRVFANTHSAPPERTTPSEETTENKCLQIPEASKTRKSVKSGMGKYLNDVLAVSILEFYLPERKGGPQGGPLRCIYKKKKKKNFFFQDHYTPAPPTMLFRSSCSRFRPFGACHY